MRLVLEKAGAVLASAALCSLMLAPGLAAAADAAQPSAKDETVHVYTSPNGTVTRTEVETILKNADGAQQLADETTLTAIEVDDEGQTRSGEGPSLVWNAAGSDVAYSGASSDAAPVSISVTYALDGQQIAPDQLAGRSGMVTIRYDYANASTASATVNGSSTSIYTPFTCITALMLDGKSFKDIKVENAKVIEDGDDVIVMGYAMPGLKESLGAMADDASIPEHFQITADVADFELSPSMTIVTAGLMSDLGVDGFGMGNLDDASTLTSAMGQLVDASSQLSDGLDVLSGGIESLDSNSGSLISGVTSVKGGLALLAYGNGTVPGLCDASDGAASLAAGLSKANDGVAALASEESGLPKLASSLKALNGAALDEATLSAAGEAIAAVEDPDAKAALMAVLQSAAALSASAGDLSLAADAAASGAAELSSQMPAVVAGANELSLGLSSAADLAEGLYAGSGELEAGAAALSDATSRLSAGATAAAEGSQALTDGMRTFNDEGVAKLVSTLQNDYGGLLDRMSALSDAAKSYDNFAGKTPGTPSSVKFVFETDGIAK